MVDDSGERPWRKTAWQTTLAGTADDSGGEGGRLWWGRVWRGRPWKGAAGDFGGDGGRDPRGGRPWRGRRKTLAGTWRTILAGTAGGSQLWGEPGRRRTLARTADDSAEELPWQGRRTTDSGGLVGLGGRLWPLQKQLGGRLQRTHLAADDPGGDLLVNDSDGGDSNHSLADNSVGDGGRPWHDSASRKKSLADSGADDSMDDCGCGRRGRARTSLLL